MRRKQKKEESKPEETQKNDPAPQNQENSQAAPDTSQPVMIAIAMDEYSNLLRELDEKRRAAAENQDGWARERADFMNYKRRIERDQESLTQNLTGQIIKKYLVILDDIELALKTRPQTGEGAAWAEGIELIRRKLLGILESEGVERIPEDVREFDPAIHEALTYEESPDHKTGEVIEIVQHGYKIGDWVLRPALVRVAR